jgi:putative transcriptional regulator
MRKCFSFHRKKACLPSKAKNWQEMAFPKNAKKWQLKFAAIGPFRVFITQGIENWLGSKVTLHKFTVEIPDSVQVSPDEIKAVRESTHSSQAVMAMRLHVNPRTYQNWEQGKAKPNATAAVLIKLVEKHPETLASLESL